MTHKVNFSGETLMLAKRFAVVIERRIVMPDITSFLTAAACLFASFYNFNLHYGDGSEATLESVQRYASCM